MTFEYVVLWGMLVPAGVTMWLGVGALAFLVWELVTTE